MTRTNSSTLFILFIVLVFSFTKSFSQLPVEINGDAILQAEQQEHMRLEADSLKALWSVMWRASDSLRIESIFKRMKSDSIKRVLSSSDTISKELKLLAKARVAKGRLSKEKWKPGQTLSDSLTSEMLKAFPDTGVASYYASEFHGKATSSGERYNMNDLTCAHRWLPFGTRVRVTNPENGKSVVVRVNDRGPFKHTRIIDLSKKAATELGMIARGTATVVVRIEE